jgi:DNA polymerase V
MPIADIWGIGRRLEKWFTARGISTALQFKQANPELVRKKMGVVGQRLLLELQGISCLPLELIPNPKQETCLLLMVVLQTEYKGCWSTGRET